MAQPKKPGLWRRLWRTTANFDTALSWLERTDVHRLLGSVALTALWTIIGYLRSVEPYWLGVGALATFGAAMWAWNQVTIRRGLRYLTIDEKLGAQAPVTGSLAAADEGDILAATGTAGLQGLYVGNIIAAAGSLESEHRLELAVTGFNGTGEAIIISEISGRIKTGSGNLRDMAPLDIPAIRQAVRAQPWAEFTFVLNQHVTPARAREFLIALEEKHLTLDLRELKILAACQADITRSEALPLWDGVTLRRRDDVVSNRVTILSVGMAVEKDTALALKAAQ